MNFTHYDGPDGRKYVRVSRVLSIIADKGIQRWREIVGTEEADRRKREAADWGTEVHDITTKMDLGEWPEIPERSLFMVMRYVEWRDKYVTRVISTEKPYYSVEHGFAGTIDLIATLKNSILPSIIDKKTGGINKKAFTLQVAGAYKLLATENGIETAQPLILPLDKKVQDAGALEVIPLNEEGAQEAWLNVLGLYRWMTNEKWERQ